MKKRASQLRIEDCELRIEETKTSIAESFNSQSAIRNPRSSIKKLTRQPNPPRRSVSSGRKSR